MKPNWHGNRKIGRAELVLAYELRQAGVLWKLIAWGLGVERAYLQRMVARCEREGLDWLPEVSCG